MFNAWMLVIAVASYLLGRAVTAMTRGPAAPAAGPAAAPGPRGGACCRACAAAGKGVRRG